MSLIRPLRQLADTFRDKCQQLESAFFWASNIYNTVQSTNVLCVSSQSPQLTDAANQLKAIAVAKLLLSI